MGDPLSVGASAVGIISLGLTVSNGLLDYYNAFKDQPADVAQMITSLQSLSQNLEAIDRKVQHPLLNREAVHGVTENLESCAAGVHILQVKLDKIRNTKPGVRASVQRAKYPFQRKTLDKLAQTISVVQNHLSLAISALQLDVSITSLVRHDDLKANLDEFRTDVVNRFTRLDFGQEQETLRSLKSHEEEALTWLSQLEFHSKHNDARTRRQEGTGQWFLESEEFSWWVNTDARVLWCPGLRK
ncbi:MAG: hypothetical protein LQ344_004599 [Seirophora lacunosa]|nr:MAG: hypothetical protein LQ344_004599 [Seirophora lacunosa]